MPTATTQEMMLDDELILALGFDDLTEFDQTALLEQWGSIVVESALNRLLRDLGEAGVLEFEKEFSVLLAEHGEGVYLALCERYPQFAQYVLEETSLLKQEARRVVLP